MKPIPIPDELVPIGFVRKTLGAPRGMESTVQPVETLVPGRDVVGDHQSLVLLQFSEQDVDWLQENKGLCWLRLVGGLVPPFNLMVLRPSEVSELVIPEYPDDN